MPSSLRGPWLAAVSLAVMGAIATPVEAFEVVMTADAGAEYTSNTLLTDGDEIGEWIYMPGASIAVSQDSAKLEMALDYSYVRRMYTEDYWSDDNRLAGNARIDWHALPERLDFFVYNSRTESTLQAQSAETPGNRQTVSTTDAGSRLLFQPREGDELQFEYLFRDINTTETNTNSQRHNGTARYILGLSENRALVVEGTYSDINYDGPFPDADYQVAMIGYRQTAGSLEIDLNVGYNWFDRQGRGTTDNPSYDGSLTWHASSTSTFTLTGSKRITDQGSDLASGDSAVENTNVNAAFEQTSASIGYVQEFGANRVSLGGYYDYQEYAPDVPLTNKLGGARLDYARTLTRSTTLTAYVNAFKRNYEDQGDDQKELQTGFRVSHRLGRSIDLNWGFRYEKRDAQTSTSYEVWYGDAQLTWTFLGAARTP